MFEITKLGLNPEYVLLGSILVVVFQLLQNTLKSIIRQNTKTRSLWIIVTASILVMPVYIKNSDFFYISPDSQGLLRSPEGDTTYRPPLLWLVYRIFVNQDRIDRFFSTNPVSGNKQTYSFLLAGSNFILLIYLVSLISLVWVFYHYLKINGNLLILGLLIQISGPLYFQSDYYFIPTELVPVYRILLYSILLNLIFVFVRQNKNSKIDVIMVKKLVFILSGIGLLLIASRSSIMVDELNQIMTETLTMTLINSTIGLTVVLVAVNKERPRKIIALALGLTSGLLLLVKLSTILIPLLVVIFVFMTKAKIKERVVISAIVAVAILIPLTLTTIAKVNSESSQTWYGLVSYAIEFQIREPAKLNLSVDAATLLQKSIENRNSTWAEYPDLVSQYKFTYQKTPIALFYGALPAARELRMDTTNERYLSELFKEITIASFLAHKQLAGEALLENLTIPIGIFKFDGQYSSLSKILKNPLVHFLLIILMLGYFSRRTRVHSFTLYILFCILLLNYVVVSVFNGPLARYFYLYDPLILYIVIIGLSVQFDEEKRNVDKNEKK
jgi:hypothetical protein